MKIYATRIFDIYSQLDNESDRIIKYLDKDRQKKISQIKHEGERLRSIFAGLLFRYVYLNNGFSIQDWDKMEIEYNEYGKPSVKGVDGFNYSISHSGDWIICAYDEENIGADIQEKRPWKLQMAKRFYSDKEYNRLISIDKNSLEKQNACFYKIWSAKECCVKYTGRGIGAGISQYVTDDEFGIIDEYATNGNIINKYYIKIYDELDGYIISVCSKKNQFPFNINIVERDLLIRDGGQIC